MAEQSEAALRGKLTDLDYAVLAILPAEGMRKGNHTFAKQVSSMVEELEDATGAQLNGRLRSLKHLGLVTKVVVQPVGEGAGWQATELGLRVLSARNARAGLATVHTLRGGG